MTAYTTFLEPACPEIGSDTSPEAALIHGPVAPEDSCYVACHGGGPADLVSFLWATCLGAWSLPGR